MRFTRLWLVSLIMKQYTWNSRVEVLEKGEVKDLRIELVNYGPSGQLQRNTLNDQSAPLPFGFLRRKIEERERAKVEEYLVGLRSLLEQYTLPSEGKILAFMNQAATSGPDANGLFEMTGQNVVYPGDAFSVWFDARTRQTRRIQVTTVFQGDQVDLTATFKTLKSGLTYMPSSVRVSSVTACTGLPFIRSQLPSSSLMYGDAPTIEPPAAR